MKTMTAEEASKNFVDLIAAGRNGPVEIMKSGKSVGYFVSLDDLGRLQQEIEDDILGAAATKALAGGLAEKERVNALMARFPDAGA